VKYKFICRIDQQNTHCWTLRIMEGRENGINKAFTDGVYGGKLKALQAAIKFRDKFLKDLPPDIELRHRHTIWPKFRSKGYFFGSRKRETTDDYLYYTAFCYDKFDKIQLQKSFGFVTWGGKKKARMKAIEWRNKTRAMVERKARALGLKP